MCQGLKQITKLKSTIKCLLDEVNIKNLVIKQLRKLHESYKSQQLRTVLVKTNNSLVYSRGQAKPNLPNQDVKAPHRSKSSAYIKKYLALLINFRLSMGFLGQLLIRALIFWF